MLKVLCNIFQQLMNTIFSITKINKKDDWEGIKTQMGTNLLDLSPFSQTSELVVVPGYGYCGWSFSIDAACALSSAPTQNLPLLFLQR
jgi:hypothetical protein